MTMMAARASVVAAMAAQVDKARSLPLTWYYSRKYIYMVYELLPKRWYILVYYRNKNGSKGGVCRMLDELDGPRCVEKAYGSCYKAQKRLDSMAMLCGWKAYKE